ncbi:hypothetical protein DM860_004692 [Cuscuta australis]|uniref:Uncharacterized protein n=1 Tax=Cuscuta australis TaxID=267555 RepID=A0A328DQZ5_9ASTE|nr:hypothetical protein DM860_004692 [Cuscuta australis]
MLFDIRVFLLVRLRKTVIMVLVLQHLLMHLLGKENISMQKNILHGQLSRAQIELLVDTVLKLYPQEVQMYQSFTKKELSVAYLEGVV